MVDRIRLILQAKQLTPTQFADAIGAARPVVSHILSGRNKPSLEVVQKILAAFPDLSMAWLLNGIGTMSEAPAPVQAPATATAAPLPAPAGDEAEAAGHPAPPKARRVAPPAPVASPAPAVPAAAPPVLPQPLQVPEPTSAPLQPLVVEPAPAPLPAPAQGLVPVAATPAAPVPPTPPAPTQPVSPPAEPVAAGGTAAPDPAASALLAAPGKAIRRIVIFYKDGSFADYQPE